MDPLATTGSLKAGGRFNPPNEFGALYTSLDPKTAAQEAARGLRARGIDPEQFPEGAWWVDELKSNLESVLDLTDPAILEKSAISADSLTGSNVNAARLIAVGARTRLRGVAGSLCGGAGLEEFGDFRGERANTPDCAEFNADRTQRKNCLMAELRLADSRDVP